MAKLFIYGTLQEADVQIKVIGRSLVSKPDFLSNYEMGTVTINGNVYPIIYPLKGKSIAGKVIDVTPKELKLIDDYETSAYKRVRVLLQSGISADVYSKP